MKIFTSKANYWIKYKGRGLINIPLTNKQARVLFDLVNILEIEYIKIENGAKYNENKIFTCVKAKWFSAANEEEFNSI